MNNLDNKKIMILAHLYDFLKGGYFASFRQLEFIDKSAYSLCKKNEKIKITKQIENIKKEIPEHISRMLEISAEYRYLICDGFHDAQVVECFKKGDALIVYLNLSHAYCGFNYVNDIVKIEIKNSEIIEHEKVLEITENIKNRIYWLSSDICFVDNYIKFLIEFRYINKKQVVDIRLNLSPKSIKFKN